MHSPGAEGQPHGFAMKHLMGKEMERANTAYIGASELCLQSRVRTERGECGVSPGNREHCGKSSEWV